MSLSLDADRQAVVDEVRLFVEREVIPVAHDLEKNDTYPFESHRETYRLSVFLALQFPKPMVV